MQRYDSARYYLHSITANSCCGSSEPGTHICPAHHGQKYRVKAGSTIAAKDVYAARLLVKYYVVKIQGRN